MIPDTLEALAVPLSDLRPYKANPRQGDVGAIVTSLEANGQYRPIVVNRRDQSILAGNHTFWAAKELGWSEIAATYVDVDDETARRIVLIDNRANDLASYDEAVLAELLQAIVDEQGADGLLGTGYDADDLEELLPRDNREGEDTEPPEPPAEPFTRHGDLWRLGRHRLLCGDSTLIADVDVLVDGQAPDLLYTDPPYGMSYKSSKHAVIKGDDLRDAPLRTMVRSALRIARERCTAAAAAYVWCTWRTYPDFVRALEQAELVPTACIVWNKGRIGPGAMHYRPQHEFCLYCRPEEPNDHDLCIYCKGDEWLGMRGETDVWTMSRDTGYRHPTQKPTALAERAIKNSTRPDGIVIDCFGGSGSTLLAAENLNRTALTMELDPAYCDVICQRFQEHTGVMPIRAADDEPHDFTA